MLESEPLLCNGALVNNAIWLLLALPGWYFRAILSPLSAGFLTAIPAAGTLSLVIGIVLGLLRPDPKLLLFLIPVVFSELIVAMAGVFRGQLSSNLSGYVLLAFLLVQLLLSAYLVYLIRDARWSAAALGFFSLTYALFAAFIATMSLTDTWL